MKNKNNSVLAVLVFVALCLVGEMVYIYLSREAVPEAVPVGPSAGESGNSKTSNGSETSADKTSADNITAVDTSDWQTYRNREWGIEIEYPAQWEIEGNEIRDPNSNAYLEISRLSNPQNLSFADWWEENMIVGGRPTVLYSSADTTINGVAAKIAGQSPNKSGWQVHIADRRNNIYSLLALGEAANKQTFDQMLSTFKFTDSESNVSGQTADKTYTYGNYKVQTGVSDYFEKIGYRATLGESWDDDGCAVLKFSLKPMPGSQGFAADPDKYSEITPLVICPKSSFCKANDCPKLKECSGRTDLAPECDNFLFQRYIGQNADYIVYTQGGSSGGDVYDYNGWKSGDFSNNTSAMYESVTVNGNSIIY
jgi:hypothetical protein